ncbi:MAG: response regulator [Fusobacteriota bacterium]
MKILVVEDSKMMQRLIERIVKTINGESDIAKDGRQGLKMFEDALKSDKSYDLVLLDIMLPKLDGIQVLEVMREIEKEYGKRTKILMQSSLNDLVTIEQTQKADGFLVKPYSKEVLLDKLKQIEAI